MATNNQYQNLPPYSGLCIAGFITSFFSLLPISIVLSILGVKDCNLTGKRGKGLGIAALFINGIYVLVIVIILFTTVFAAGVGNYVGRSRRADRSERQHN